MSNCYQIATMVDSMWCPDEIWPRIREALRGGQEEALDAHGFHCEFDRKANGGGWFYMFSEDWANPDNLSEDFMELFAYLLVLNDLPFMEFGVAYYCDKAMSDSAGGFRFRLHVDATLEYSETVWVKGADDGAM